MATHATSSARTGSFPSAPESRACEMQRCPPRTFRSGHGAAGPVAIRRGTAGRLRGKRRTRLLRETQLSVVTVANEVGYSSPSHFAPVFRKHTGLSTSDYRRQRQGSAGRR
ncbi:helix-turn-helix domain-containing protein [Pseudomonas sp. Pseusp16]|uniref:helix-turn-helix domain-containing protein n=1 Tax=Pseudomonas sp. Pseusp16 TaxID=3243021 RepID=UPI0039B61113